MVISLHSLPVYLQVIAMCGNRGPLTLELTQLQFFFMMLMPVVPLEGVVVDDAGICSAKGQR